MSSFDHVEGVGVASWNVRADSALVAAQRQKLFFQSVDRDRVNPDVYLAETSRTRDKFDLTLE